MMIDLVDLVLLIVSVVVVDFLRYKGHKWQEKRKRIMTTEEHWSVDRRWISLSEHNPNHRLSHCPFCKSQMVIDHWSGNLGDFCPNDECNCEVFRNRVDGRMEYHQQEKPPV